MGGQLYFPLTAFKANGKDLPFGHNHTAMFADGEVVPDWESIDRPYRKLLLAMLLVVKRDLNDCNEDIRHFAACYMKDPSTRPWSYRWILEVLGLPFKIIQNEKALLWVKADSIDYDLLEEIA